MTPTPKSEPVLTATLLAPVVVWAAAYFGLSMDTTTATQLAGVVLLAGSVLARSRVRTRASLPDPTAVKPPPSAAPLFSDRATKYKTPPFDPP